MGLVLVGMCSACHFSFSLLDLFFTTADFFLRGKEHFFRRLFFYRVLFPVSFAFCLVLARRQRTPRLLLSGKQKKSPKRLFSVRILVLT